MSDEHPDVYEDAHIDKGKAAGRGHDRLAAALRRGQLDPAEREVAYRILDMHLVAQQVAGELYVKYLGDPGNPAYRAELGGVLVELLNEVRDDLAKLDP